MNPCATTQQSEITEPCVESVPKPDSYTSTWPSVAELERGHESLEPGPCSTISGYAERYRDDLSEFFASDERDRLRVFAEPDRHDTIPSPPPELESAPIHDER